MNPLDEQVMFEKKRITTLGTTYVNMIVYIQDTCAQWPTLFKHHTSFVHEKLRLHLCREGSGILEQITWDSKKLERGTLNLIMDGVSTGVTVFDIVSFVRYAPVVIQKINDEVYRQMQAQSDIAFDLFKKDYLKASLAKDTEEE